MKEPEREIFFEFFEEVVLLEETEIEDIKKYISKFKSIESEEIYE